MVGVGFEVRSSLLLATLASLISVMVEVVLVIEVTKNKLFRFHKRAGTSEQELFLELGVSVVFPKIVDS